MDDLLDRIVDKSLRLSLIARAMRDEITALRAALAPFAQAADECPPEWGDGKAYGVPVGALRKAREVLRAEEEEMPA